ncbi:class I SAM-dependent methyltransferase [Glycomyces sp. NPDC049804]|uniref:class I SAM-dependent methyltransferase n=1 Tax=Glycomyces sp. NPDC049804 TaxID=3154363 RepID=UPI00342E3CA4
MGNQGDQTGWRDRNHALWDERVDIHAVSASYNIDGFLKGDDVLMDFEPGEIGDVTGKRLVHLQCHMGQETLTWLRRGASRVVGLDFSESAIGRARELAAELGFSSTEAAFTVADLYDAPNALPETEFDVVYVSMGSINWLPDIGRWARIVADLLIPGGILYLNEFHPVTHVLDEATGTRFVHDYITSQAMVREAPGTYTDSDRSAPTVHNTAIEWIHSLGDVLSALAVAGLRLEFLHEHDRTVFRHFANFERGADGWWGPPPGQPRIPLLYSLKASKPLNLSTGITCGSSLY